MTDAISTFFANLVERGQQPLLGHTCGTVDIELLGGRPGEGSHWRLGIDEGAISLSDEVREPADCTVRTEKAYFEQLIAGRQNAISAVLRGEIECFGDVEMLMVVQRIFPGPPRRTGGTAGAGDLR